MHYDMSVGIDESWRERRRMGRLTTNARLSVVGVLSLIGLFMLWRAFVHDNAEIGARLRGEVEVSSAQGIEEVQNKTTQGVESKNSFAQDIGQVNTKTHSAQGFEEARWKTIAQSNLVHDPMRFLNAPIMQLLPKSRQKCDYFDAERSLREFQDAEGEMGQRFRVFLHEVAADPGAKGEVPTAFLSMASIHYKARFEEFIATFRALFPGVIAMIALDEETAKYFRERNIPTLHYDINFAQIHPNHEKSVREVVMRAKIDGVLALTLIGFRVLFAEMDIFCRTPPLPYLEDPSVDLIFSEHTYTPEINFGFFFARPTCSAQRAFQKVRDWVRRPDRRQAYCTYTFDQKLMDYAVRGTGELARPGGCSGFDPTGELYDASSKLLRFRYVPYGIIAHVNLPANETGIVCAHIYSGLGTLDYRIKYAFEHKWYSNSSESAVQLGLDILKNSKPI